MGFSERYTPGGGSRLNFFILYFRASQLILTTCEARLWFHDAFSRTSDASGQRRLASLKLLHVIKRCPPPWRIPFRERGSSGAAMIAKRPWAEVLNPGGWDLLMKPSRADEVVRVVELACESLSRGQNTKNQVAS